MVYICVICSVKEPPLLPLSVNYRQLLEVIISPVINIEELRAYTLLLCGNCVNLMQAVHNFQQTAATGVKNLKSLLKVLIKHEENTNIAGNAVFAELNPTKITIKMELETELPAVSQEFVAVPSPDIIPVSVHSTLKGEPKTEDYDSDSTVSCVTKYEEAFDELCSETPEHRISPPQPTCGTYFGQMYLQTPIPILTQTSEIYRPATLTQVPQYKKIAPKRIIGNTATPQLTIPTNSLNSAKLIMVPNTRISNTAESTAESFLVNVAGLKNMAVPIAGNRTMAPGTNQTSNPMLITNATPKSADTAEVQNDNFKVFTHQIRPYFNTVQWMNGFREPHRKHKEKPLPPKQCPFCFKSISSANLSGHIARQHGALNPCTCDICGRDYRNEALLKVHITQVHKRKENKETNIDDVNIKPELFCKECCVQFLSPSQYKVHLLSLKHTPREKYEFECEVCKKRYPSAHRRQQHMDGVHLDKKKFECDQCGKKYIKKSGLRLHIETAHLKLAKISKHVCHLCGKAFTIKKSLREHILSHQGLRPFQCKLCPSTFTYSAALYTHNKLKHLKIKRKWKKKRSQKRKQTTVEKGGDLLTSLETGITSVSDN